MSVLEQIKKKLQAKNADKMTEIDLADTAIGKFTNEIRAYLAGFKHVEILILTGCELTSLENMPDWSLSAIDVSNNKLDDSAIAYLAKFRKLNQLICAENFITSKEALKPLSQLQNLAELDLAKNPVSSSDGYRDYVFGNLAQLEILDSKDKDGNDVAEEAEFDDDADDDDDEDDDDEFDDDEDYDEDEDSESEKPTKKKK